MKSKSTLVAKIFPALFVILLVGVLVKPDEALIPVVNIEPDQPDDDRSRDGEGDTFSIVAYDPVTGEVGGAGCSCFSGTIDFLSDLVLDSSNTIIGGIHTQASYTSGNQNNARTRMLAGDTPSEIITWLANNDCCSSNPNSRQYGIVGFDFSTNPPTLETAGFTGASNGNFANDIQGPNYAIQGNILDVPNGQALLESMENGFLNTPGSLADKLMGALQGAKRVGGDNRCVGSGISGRAAFVKVLRPGDTQPYIDISLYPNTSWIEPIDELQCAYDAQFAPPNCVGTVTSFPYTMDFEDLVWVKDDTNCGPAGSTNSWIRSRFSTPTGNTGPTGASQGAHYMFVEGNQGNNDRAIVKSPCFVLPSNEAQTLSFDCHMFGTNMGSLSVTINDGSGWATLWSASGDQGNQWIPQQIDLSAYQGDTVTIRFDATTGGGAASDMAIDNIRIGQPVPVNCNNVVSTYPYAESFESNFGLWEQSSADDLNWTRDANGTPSNNTGPSNAFDGSWYIYVEASGNGTGYPNKRAILTSPCYDLTDKTSASFDFNYHMFGSSNMGSIDLEASTNGTSWTSIWNQTGNQGNQWLSESVDLSAYLGESTLLLRWNRLTGGTWQADIAIDNIVLNAAGGPDLEPPTAPTGLTASNTTDTTTDLSWNASTDNVGVTEYDVYEGTSVIGSTANTNFDVTGLTASTSYSFTVVAKDAAGNESPPSNEVNVTTNDPPDTEPPSVPVNLTANSTTTTSTNLTWDASTDNVGVTGYDVFQNSVLIGSPTGTSFNVTGLSPSTGYSFTVLARDAAGNQSAQSAPLVVTTLDDTTPPTAPTNLIASNTTTTTTNLSWDASSDDIGVTGYDVYQGVSVIGTTVTTNFNVIGLTPSTNYSFTVVAKDAAGNESPPSNVVNVTTQDPSTGCSGGVSTYPYTEGFEGSIGDWIQGTGDDLNWTVDSNGTPSNNTGPSSADEGTFYIYVEASGNGTGYPNKQAVILSPCFDLSGESAAYFNFSVHQFGSTNMGSITLDISDDDGQTWNTLWSQTGNQGNSWQGVSIDLSAYLGGGVQLRFDRITGGTWQADIALDNISMTNTEPSGCTGGVSLPYSESFESSIGAWSQATGDDLNWTRDANGTPSNNTGPSSASDGSFYMYVEASGNGTGYPNKQAIFNSPCFDLSGVSTAEINFDYHMFGSSNMGSISLQASGDDGQSWQTLWSQTGNQGNQWLSQNVDLSAYAGNGLLLRFNRITGGTWQADIAIDNVSVTGSVSFQVGVDPFFVNNNPEVGFSIYPNPVNGATLFISTNASATDYTVYNMTGQVMSKGPYTDTVDVSRLSAGMYFIVVNAGNQTFTERFIRE